MLIRILRFSPFLTPKERRKVKGGGKAFGKWYRLKGVAVGVMATEQQPALIVAQFAAILGMDADVLEDELVRVLRKMKIPAGLECEDGIFVPPRMMVEAFKRVVVRRGYFRTPGS